MMRDIIMGITPFPVEECVGNYRKVTKNTQVKRATGARTDRNPERNPDKKSTYAKILMRGENENKCEIV